MAFDYSRFDRIKVELDGAVLRIKLNLPEKRNIITDPVNEQISDAFQAASYDKRVRVVVLSGEGPSFCGGGDFAQMKRKVDDPRIFFDNLWGSRRLVNTVLDCPKPTIAKLHGHAMGLGATLPLLCDLVIAVDDTKIADPHVNIGLVAGDGGSLIWPQQMGYAKARKFLLLGEPISGKEAADLGLIAESAPTFEAMEEIAGRWEQKLANSASNAVYGTKTAINMPLRQLAQSMMDLGMAYEGLSNISDDHREAIDAILEKRKPSFTGE
jgi:Enoyl-CoA hydratase/carnithine racemase